MAKIDIFLGNLNNYPEEVQEKLIADSEYPDITRESMNLQLKAINALFETLVEEGYECYKTPGPNGMEFMFAKVDLDDYWKFYKDLLNISVSAIDFDEDDEDD